MAASAAISMAASCAASNIVPIRTDPKFSSLSSFGSTMVHLGPPRPVVKRCVGATRASLPAVQDCNTARRGVLAGLLAVGATFATGGSTLSATGPGGAGAQRTNEKAGELLKAADDLTNNDSPTRFGPGRDESLNPSEGGQVAEKAGAGAVGGVQDAAASSAEGSSNVVEEAKKNFGNIFSMGNNKTGDLSANVLSDPKGKVSSDIDTAKGKVGSDVSSTSENAKSLSDSGKSKAGSFVADAKSNAGSASDDVTKAGKDFFGNLVNKVQETVPQ